MNIPEKHSYRHAEAIIATEYPEEKKEIIESLQEVSWVLLDPPKVRKRKDTKTGKERIVATLKINQKETNKLIENSFRNRGWDVKPRIISESKSGLESDFRKGPIQVEVQFGNMARWYTDVFKFLLSYSANDIEIGVLVVPMKETADIIDENVANFERVIRELPHAKMGITIHIWVIGVKH